MKARYNLLKGVVNILAMGFVFFTLAPSVTQGMLYNPVEETLHKHEEAQELRDEVQTLRAGRDEQLHTQFVLKQELDRLQRETDRIDERLGHLAEQADGTAITAPGLIITISDAPIGVVRSAGEMADINWFLVHDKDILRVINVLKGAGARAVAVNGVRVTSSMAIRCGGPAIYIREVPLVPPFRILAVGDADTMKLALTGREDIPAADVYLEMVSARLIFQIESSDVIEMPAADSTQAVQRAAQAAK